ncbi:Tn3 family transposase [Nonomuraea angiospora]|uniref:Tn3 family transposase n=1 Tax=Nonomuraea angiospora TaxID=46172 RepID=UPI00340A1676
MLLINAYGTNCGIRSVTSGAHPHTEEELRYVRRRCLSAEVARMVAVEIANATFAVRDAGLWGAGLWGAGSLARRAWVGGGALPAPPKPHTDQARSSASTPPTPRPPSKNTSIDGDRPDLLGLR